MSVEEEVLREYRPGKQPEPDVRVWTPRKKARPQTADLEDTQSLDTAQIKKRVRRAQAAPEAVTYRPRHPQKAEPFSAEWEPDYEPPTEGYVAAPPVRPRPRSRLGELRQALREGPEKIYDSLMEKGMVRLQVGLFFSVLIVVLAVGAMVLYQLDMVRPERMRHLVFGELFAMLMSALLCWERLAEGLMALLRLRFTLDSLLLCAFTACVADGIFCLQRIRMPFGGVFCVMCLVCLWGQYQRRTVVLTQTDVLRRANRLDRVVRVGNCFEGKPGFHVCEGAVSDYMDTLDQPSTPQRVLDGYALGALVVSGGVALWAGSQGGVEAGVRTWAVAILAAVPATVFLSQSRPAVLLQRRLRRFGAVLCGWQGILQARGPAVVPVGEAELFPGTSLKINGIKLYAGRSPDALLGYATAVLEAGGDCTADVFAQLLHSRHAQPYEVQELQRFGNRGYGALVCGQRVLLGSREFLEGQGVRVDPGARVSHAVYMAVDGEFSGIFAMALGKTRGARAGLGALCSQRGLMPVITTTNFLVTRDFLADKFGVDARQVCFPGLDAREALAQWAPEYPAGPPCALLTQEGLGGLALSVAGARTLYASCVAGAAVHILAGVIGLGAVAALTALGRTELLTPMNLLLTELIWAIPGLLIGEWTRKR